MNNKVKIIFVVGIVGILFYFTKILISNKQIIDNETVISNVNAQLIIKPEYDQYLYNQKIWMVCKILNNSSDNYIMEEYFNWNTLNFKILSPNGKIIEYHDDGDQIEPKPIILAPGEVFETVINLDWYFASRPIEENEVSGVYEVTAQYQNLKSNKVKLDIMAPEGIDRLLYEKTSKTRKLPVIPSESNELQNLLEEYPSSKYSPQLYKILFLRIVGEGDSSRFFHNFNKYIDNYKNSYETVSIIKDFQSFTAGHLNWNSEQIQNKISELMYNNTGTKIEKSILYLENYVNLLNKMKEKQ